MGVFRESSPGSMLFGIIRQLYCIIRWGVTGDNLCVVARARTLEMAGKGIGALFKKLFMSSASSAIGTGTVLGLHGAMAPDEATFQSSDLSEATVDESRNMLKVDMDGSTSYFAIALLVLLCLVVMVATTICCGCSPSKMAKRRQEEEWKEEIRGMMEKRNMGDAELGLEAEGWTEINKGKTGPRLVEGA